MSKEAMKLALEALEGVVIPSWRLDEIKEQITALKQALEQPEPEPREHPPCKGMNCGITRTDQQHSIECEAEHAAAIAGGRFVKPEQPEPEPEPVAWTDENFTELAIDEDIAKEIGATIPLYTSPPKREPEPVAWRDAALRVGEDLCSVGPFGYYDMTAEQWLDWALSVVTVHAPPPKREPEPEPVIDKSAAIRIATSLGWTPKREWQGLTDEEIDEGQRQSWVDKQAFESAVWWAEAKLKEKNT